MSSQPLDYGTTAKQGLPARQRVKALAIGFVGTGLLLALGWAILACLVRFGFIRVY